MVRAQELIKYTSIRGTQVSACMLAPSLLHVSVTQSFGVPDRHGNVIVDNHTVYMRRDRQNPDHMYVYAFKNDPTSASEEWCVLL